MRIKISELKTGHVNFVDLDFALETLAQNSVEKFDLDFSVAIGNYKHTLSMHPDVFLDEFRKWFQDAVNKEYPNQNLLVTMNYSCHEACSPSDFTLEGKCAKMGCYGAFSICHPMVTPLSSLVQVTTSLSQLSQRSELLKVDLKKIACITEGLIDQHIHLKGAIDGVDYMPKGGAA